jgi:hypothetical protein
MTTIGISVIVYETLQSDRNFGHMLMNKFKVEKYLKRGNCLRPKAKPLVCATAVLSPQATISVCWLLQAAFVGLLFLVTSICYS